VTYNIYCITSFVTVTYNRYCITWWLVDQWWNYKEIIILKTISVVIILWIV